MNKKDVAGLVKELGLDKTLFPVTETCETEIFVYPNMTRDFNMFYTNPNAEPCKRCWFVEKNIGHMDCMTLII